MTEFELIRRFFATPPVRREDVVLGVGDDAALLDVPAGEQLVVTTDVLVSGVHFLPDVDPAALGHKALAVNLSDLAAMGATPAWFTLDLVLPTVEEDWLTRFAGGLQALAAAYGAQLVGGDTSRGPLAVTITALGLVPRGQALTRAGARAGDAVYVTGTLGDAALALTHLLDERKLPESDFAAVRERLERPQPRIAAGQLLRGLASSAIDISDGLLADLGHILEASNVGAELRLADIPLSSVARAQLEAEGWETMLATGDDYELCFTVPAARAAEFARIAPKLAPAATRIGEIVAAPGLVVRDAGGHVWQPRATGHDHFAHEGGRA